MYTTSGLPIFVCMYLCSDTGLTLAHTLKNLCQHGLWLMSISGHVRCPNFYAVLNLMKYISGNNARLGKHDKKHWRWCGVI